MPQYDKDDYYLSDDEGYDSEEETVQSPEIDRMELEDSILNIIEKYRGMSQYFEHIGLSDVLYNNNNNQVITGMFRHPNIISRFVKEVLTEIEVYNSEELGFNQNYNYIYNRVARKINCYFVF